MLQAGLLRFFLASIYRIHTLSVTELSRKLLYSNLRFISPDSSRICRFEAFR